MTTEGPKATTEDPEASMTGNETNSEVGVEPMTWQVVRYRSTAGDLHGREIPEEPVPAAWFLEATGPALVLGSAEPVEHVNPDQLRGLGLELVRRRSGGGAVLVLPGRCTWLDLIVPVGHHLWDPDVGRAMHWVGDLWQGALADLGIESQVNRGPMQRTKWSRHACFAGLGPGEVTDGEGRKLVGISQRRTRTAARFQTVAYHEHAISSLVDLLDLGEAERADLRAELDTTTGLIAAPSSKLAAALVSRLPQ